MQRIISYVPNMERTANARGKTMVSEKIQIGTKRHNVTMQKHFEFFKKGSGVKILIINPTPKYAYICDTESVNEKRLFNADKLWDYVAYEAEAFIGALDRDCLGKYSSVSESKDVHVQRLPNIHL